jgi:membrane protease YdiL (CAAX protease family)
VTSAAPASQGVLARLSHSAIVRIVLEAAGLLITIVATSIVLGLIVPPAPSPLHTPLAMLRNLVAALIFLGVYALLIRVIERRRASEIAPRAATVPLPLGLVVGVGLMGAVNLVFWAGGIAAFAPGTGLAGLAPGLIGMFAVAVVEELLLRAVVFRIVEQACGTTIALVLSAAIFGLLHAVNPGATLFSSAAIAIEAGLLLALAYAVTRNLWLAIGIHAGWNFAEGSLFGAQVSGGAPMPSLIHVTLHGPELVTGGTFGPEASIVSVGVCLVASAILGWLVIRRGDWQPMRFRLTLA